jgi:hypothetical protein
MRLSSALALSALPMTLALVLAACGGGGSTASNGTPGGGGTPASTCPLPTPIATPRFSVDIYPALHGDAALNGSSCGSATTNCHGKSNPPNGHIRYDLTAAEVFAELINAAPSSSPAGWVLVKPGDSGKSWLIEKVTSNSPGGGGFGTRMPQAAPDLCLASVDNFKAWIQAGAQF